MTVDDDALRAMLTTRADRIAATAADEIMQAVRAEVRGPRQGAAFSVLPVLTGRSPAIGAGWAAAAMIAVLVMVVVATHPPGTTPSASPSRGAASASALVGPTPWPSAAPSGAHISITDLRRDLNDGTSADGHLFLVNGTLQGPLLLTCPNDPCAAEYTLEFVGSVVTDQRPGQPVTPARPADGSAPLTGTFLVVPWRGTLILVGRMEGSLGSPVAVSTLTNSYMPSDPGGTIALQAVSGQIAVERVACPTVVPGPSSCTPAYVLSDPAAPGAGSTNVRMASPALGIDEGVNPISGPFLVRTGTGSQPEVVGRYDQGAIPTVDLPAVTCDLPTSTTLPSCSSLVTLAFEGLNGLGDLTSVEVHQGAWACRPADPILCPSVPPTQSAYVLIHASLGDWTIGLSFDAKGNPISIVPMPPTLPSAPESPGGS